MKSHNFPVYLDLQSGRKVYVERWLSFTSSFEDVFECGEVYPLGYGLGFFHNISDKIECIISFSTYNRIRWMDGRYVKIYSGASYLNIARSMGRHKRLLTVFYPPNPLESIGGLLGQGYPVFNGLDTGEIKLHIFNKEEGKIFTALDGVRDDIIIDIHFNRPKPIRNITPSLLIVKLSRSEAEYILKSSESVDNPFTIIDGYTSYYLAALVFDRLKYKSLREALLKILSRDRLETYSLSSLSVDDVPLVKPWSGELFLGEYMDTSLEGVLFLNHPYRLSITTDESLLDRVFRRSKQDG